MVTTHRPDSFRIRCLDLGQSEMRGPEVFWMSDWDTWLPLQFMSVLIQREGATILVNSSPPDDLDRMHQELPDAYWADPTAPHGYLDRRPEQHMEAALAAAGVRPDEVTHLVLTPLELYATGSLGLFSRAEISMSKRGWFHFHSSHRHPHDRRWRTFDRATLIRLVTDDWDRVRLLEDEDEIVPGCRTWWAGGHHRSTMVVEVDTDQGVVAISDVFFYFENVEQDRMLGLSENIYEVEAAYRRVRATSAVVVPIHDPKVFERWPGGVVSGRSD